MFGDVPQNWWQALILLWSKVAPLAIEVPWPSCQILTYVGSQLRTASLRVLLKVGGCDRPGNEILFRLQWSVQTTFGMKYVVFWVITRRRVVIVYRLFGTTYRSHLHGSRFLLGIFIAAEAWNLRSECVLPRAHVGWVLRILIQDFFFFYIVMFYLYYTPLWYHIFA
jgi:hypothetical protein